MTVTMRKPVVLDQKLIERTRRRIEEAVVAVCQETYGHGSVRPPDSFRPGLKEVERIVSYYDYYACGISVLAPLAARGDARAQKLVETHRRCMDYYRTKLYGQPVKDHGILHIPIRRLLFHAALAYRDLSKQLTSKQRNAYVSLIDQQVRAALEHCAHFHPGERRLYLGYANNHTAIFMQAIYYCGRIFKRPEWMRTALEVARRFYASCHPDGYWEEHTNILREGGPSIVYTPLTAGCLYDVLNGLQHGQPLFVKAGNFHRSFINADRELIPLADERTNHDGRWAVFGLALHSLTARGRQFIVDSLTDRDFTKESPESLGVIYHELELMRTGSCVPSEYATDGSSRIRLPLGVVRKNGWTAGVSALRALNRVQCANSDYALDQQNMLYLSHRDHGVILTGFKSKRDSQWSTFQCGADAYTDRTGTLKLNASGVDAKLHYCTFDASIRWELGRRARLTLTTDTNREVTTVFPLHTAACAKRIRSKTPFEQIKLKGFSPYTAGNTADSEAAVRFKWRNQLVIEFE
jgi:hypothetical protein